MDESQVYIKMCDKAEEIQKQWNSVYEEYSEWAWRYHEDGYTRAGQIWLPRQDELQGMVSDKEYWEIRAYPSGSRLDEGKPYEFVGYGLDITAETLEQLWLICVMEELYHKKWNGSEWVEE